jgi:hypothetical protein
LRAGEPIRIEAEFTGEFNVQANEPRRRNRRRRNARIEAIRQPGVGVLEGKMERHGASVDLLVARVSMARGTSGKRRNRWMTGPPLTSPTANNAGT